jgi:FkbM family methyltransferase
VTFVSYAQNGEDVVLARAFEPDHVGFYVDIGASDPQVDSVTKHFYDRGWRGVNVEPAELAVAELRRQRPRDVNLGIGVGAEPGAMSFYELPLEMTGCSTFSAEIAEEYREGGWEPTRRTVEVVTLAALCAEHVGDRVIDFLKIDVEGNEADVIASADFTRFRPRILIVEATVPGTRTPAHERWEPEVLRSAYRFVLFDGLNRFYVREEDAHLTDVLSAPANTFDDYLSHRCAKWREAALGLEQQRAQLRASQARLRDARTELDAVRQALSAPPRAS